MGPPSTRTATAKFGLFEADFGRRLLLKNGLRVRLQDQPFELLRLLLERPGEIVTREEIRQKLWSADTFVEFDDGLNTAIKKLRAAVGDSADNPRFIETVPRHGYRFVAPVTSASQEAPDEMPPLAQGTRKPATASGAAKFARPIGLSLAVVAVLAIAAGTYFPRPGRQAHALSDKDGIVLADFSNSTGDAVFDDALRQGLAADLAQTPFLSLLSDDQMRRNLRLMGRQPEERLTPDVAQDLCQRVGGKVYLAGTIAALGNSYVVGLNAVNCQTGEALAREQEQASSKEQVLKALGKAATRIRDELGESLQSVKKYDVPLEQVTTSSLEALKAYSLASKVVGEPASAIPYDKRAIELDPSFAMAYDGLGEDYASLGERQLAREYFTKAYDLRERTSEREKLIIASDYYVYVTGELEKANQIFEMRIKSYPRDPDAYGILAYDLILTGQYEKALPIARTVLSLNPNNVNYGNLAVIELLDNQFEEAKKTADQAFARKLDDLDLHQVLYALALLRGDAKSLSEQAAWGKGQEGEEDVMLALEADTQAQSGHAGAARELSLRASSAARRDHLPEQEAVWEAEEAVREAFFGNLNLARQEARAALVNSPGRDAKSMAALALAITGDKARTEKLLNELEKDYNVDALLQGYWVPTIRSALALAEQRPNDAIETLRSAEPYELGITVGYVDYACLYPVYLRAQAYLQQRQESRAAAEFQKFLDHRGVAWNCPLRPLTHLGLARAYRWQKDTAKARAAYQDFFALWKDADRDIPVYVAAKSEYAQLH